MKTLPEEIKQQVDVAVNLNYRYQAEAKPKLLKIAQVLKKYDLESSISDAYVYGPAVVLKCEGITNLSIAETLHKTFHEIDVHSRIKYTNGNFILTD